MIRDSLAPTNWQSLLEEYSREGCSFGCYLCSTKKTKLYEYFENRARGLSASSFTQFLESFEEFIRTLFENGRSEDILKGIKAVVDISVIKQVHNDEMLKKFVNHMRGVLHSAREESVLRITVKAFGQVIDYAKAVVSHIVEDQVMMSINYLCNRNSSFNERLGSLLVFEALAENCPTAFNVHADKILNASWRGLTGREIELRVASARALRACLRVFERRETRNRVQWYHRLAKDAIQGLNKRNDSNYHHGCLLVLGELLSNSGEFMLARYEEVASRILLFHDSTDPHVYIAMITLIPRLANFCPERYQQEHFTTCMDLMLKALRSDSILRQEREKAVVLLALKDLVLAVKRHGKEEELRFWMRQLLETLAATINNQNYQNESPCKEAIECAGVVAKALEGEWKHCARELLVPMLMSGISTTLADSLKMIMMAIPELSDSIRELLLDAIALILTGDPFRTDIRPEVEECLKVATKPRGEQNAQKATMVALEILSSFDFGQCNLLSFVSNNIVQMVKIEENQQIRAATARACCLLLKQYGEAIQKEQGVGSVLGVPIANLLKCLVQAAISDCSECVRCIVFGLLLESPELDSSLIKYDCVFLLFPGLGDGCFTVRIMAIQLIGRLGAREEDSRELIRTRSITLQSSHSMKWCKMVESVLKTVLHQLLQQLELMPENDTKQMSAKLLGVLVQSAPYVILAETQNICHVLSYFLNQQLSKKIQDPSVQDGDEEGANEENSQISTYLLDPSCGMQNGIVTAVLCTIGYVAEMACTNIKESSYLEEILGLTICAIKDKSCEETSLEAVKTLGKIVSSTGYVIKPYHDYSWLLMHLLEMLQVNDSEVRRAVAKTLGVIGALDPATQRFIQARAYGEGRLELEGVRPIKRAQEESVSYTRNSVLDGKSLDNIPAELFTLGNMAVNTEDSYSIIAMNTLLRILKQPSLSCYHKEAVKTLGTITNSLSMSAVPYLNKLIPYWCEAIYSGDDDLKIYILQHFIRLVHVVKQHMRCFLENIMKLLQDLWAANCSKNILVHILKLVGELAQVCRNHMHRHLYWLIPRFILVLETSDNDIRIKALQNLLALGYAIQPCFHQIWPFLSKLLTNRGRESNFSVQISVLKLIEAVVPQLHVAEYASSILLPLIKILDDPRSKEIRGETLNAITAVVYATGSDSKILAYVKRVLEINMIIDRDFEHLCQCIYQTNSPWNLETDLENGAIWREDYERKVPELPPPSISNPEEIRFTLGTTDMQRAWDTTQSYTYEDWADWMRRFSLQLLSLSPSPALRACHTFAEWIPGIAKDLFPASFISCWTRLNPVDQSKLVRSLEAAMASRTIPPEIITTLLNLVEFMEHDSDTQLPLDNRTLSALSMKCQAFAKALHYKEGEFQSSPTSAVEHILAIYNQLKLPEAADGLLKYAQKHLKMDLRESWYEKLHKWDKALQLYIKRASNAHTGTLKAIDANIGRMRCYSALWDWESLSALCKEQWEMSDPFVRKEIAPLAAQAAWRMGRWSDMSEYLKTANMAKDSSEASTCAFLCSVNSVYNGNFGLAQSYIEKSRELISADLAALSGESYERAYENMIRVQQLVELEEVIQYKEALKKGKDLKIKQIKEIWDARLKSVQKRAEVWESFLSVRSLVLPLSEDKHTWVRFASICQKQNRENYGKEVLLKLLGYDPVNRMRGEVGYGSGSGQPDIMFAILKHMYQSGNQQTRLNIVDRLEEMLKNDHDLLQFENPIYDVKEPSVPLVSKVYVQLANWKYSLTTELTDDSVESLIKMTEKACTFAPGWSKAWRNWAIFHLRAVTHFNDNQNKTSASEHVAPAVRGFFKSLKLSQDTASDKNTNTTGPDKDAYQDILRLLTLWFTHGNAHNTLEELTNGFNTVRIETWLVVIPQIIARIHMRDEHVQQLIHKLLEKIGHVHPQTLLYPLLVARASISSSRKSAATEALQSIRKMRPELVREAELIGSQLVEIAVLWDEKWFQALEEASRMYFAENNTQGMMDLMLPLHEVLKNRKPQTNSEKRFIQNYGIQLNEVYSRLKNCDFKNDDTTIRQAWDTYYNVFKKIDKDLRNMKSLHLSDVAPQLQDKTMNTAVPGTYAPFQEDQVRIERIVPEIQILNSKQRPRKLTIEGTDGNDYVFLLKGHEDMRQDERVMQLFGLVNTILASDYGAAEKELSIARYAVTPLSPNAGLVGWVPNCDTMHTLIKEYRESRSIPINLEHQMMKNFAPNLEMLTLLQKVEVFEHALNGTPGDDLQKIMWIKSKNSEHWLAHRTQYTRSCAVMSMVGYLLGLGDRHPSNLMIDRYSGKLVHIDFGDCFEAGMMRDKFPEKVPFRLTRMMIKAMDVSGVEGIFRKTSELVMHILRSEKMSLMAMLEAFVYDPLINWRLALNGPGLRADDTQTGEDEYDEKEREEIGDAQDIVNNRALQVTEKIGAKLTGREFDIRGIGDSVEEQIERLIQEATSHVNLCQAYIGWCPFW